MSKEINKLKRKLDASYLKYKAAIDSIEYYLDDKVDFDFAIDHYPGDGFLMLKTDNNSVAPLSQIIPMLQNSDSITEEMHKSLSI